MEHLIFSFPFWDNWCPSCCVSRHAQGLSHSRSFIGNDFGNRRSMHFLCLKWFSENLAISLLHARDTRPLYFPYLLFSAGGRGFFKWKCSTSCYEAPSKANNEWFGCKHIQVAGNQVAGLKVVEGQFSCACDRKAPSLAFPLWSVSLSSCHA